MTSTRRFPAPVSALALARAIDAGNLTPATAIERSIAAIEAHDALLGAFVATDFDAARAAAATATGPLAGIALGVKDIIDTHDLPTAYGSEIYAGHRPAADAPVVALARRAGSTVIGKTATTEFAYLQPTVTRNPVKPDHTPGGSSSGSAAAVGAGLIPFALGTQTGGSVIRPAAFCGIAGFKPSFRLIPTVGMKCFSWSLDTIGLFAAGIEDIGFCATALIGRPLRVDGRDPGAPRIGVARTHLWDEASHDMRAALETGARKAAQAGATVVDLEMPAVFAEAFAAHRVLQDFQAAQAFAFEVDHHRGRLSEILREALDHGASITPEAYDLARRTSRQARLALKDLFAEVDVILTPSTPGAAPEGLASTGAPIFNKLWTLMGTPCVNVPGLTGGGGLPLGLQIVAPFGRDLRALEAARFLEKALGA
ncbi:amidase [Methyloraptor flagellatus]|uniref:Amidase n=1 Tax=Methyloraptor flagellatus TaxID=3162530 RepID=A0AAU7XAY5_9HYPH